MYKVFFLLATILFFAEGCSDDVSEELTESIAVDTPITTDNVTDTAQGIYDLVAFNSYPAADFNDDGTSSINQLNETECFDNMSIEIVDATTFSSVFKEISYAGNLPVCIESKVVGTYTLLNDVLTMNYLQDGTSYENTFFKTGDTIRVAYREGEVLTQNTSELFVGLDNDIEFIYVRSE